MCRSHADGGRRCSRANPTRSWRTKVAERLARNRRVADRAAPRRAERLAAMIGRDEALLARIDEATDRYGEIVTDHQVTLPDQVRDLVDGLRGHGLHAVLVGGSVRDSFDGRTPKDLDFEVYGGTVEQVAAAARRHGRVDEVGKAFGVLKVRPHGWPDGAEPLDVSVPRRDNKTGVGHRGFGVEMDPDLTVTEAAARRDFTFNAMSYDPDRQVLIDPHGGADDLAARRLRHVSPAFAEDPLRVLRGVQFAARYEMTMDPETVTLCQALRPEAASLPDERVRAEWGKFYAKGVRPSAGLAVLRRTGWAHEHPGLAQVQQRRLGAVADRMVRVLTRDGVSGEDRIVPMAAVMVREMPEDDARAFLRRTVEGAKAQRAAFALSRAETVPGTEAEARVMAMNSPVPIRDRVRLAEALNQGEKARRGREVAARAGVLDGPEPDLLDGRDVMAADSRRPGPWLGEVLAAARQAQARGDFRDRETALAWLRDTLPA